MLTSDSWNERGKNNYVEKAEYLFVAFFADLHILQLFCRADTDADGRVSRDEFKRYYKQLQEVTASPVVTAPGGTVQ